MKCSAIDAWDLGIPRGEIVARRPLLVLKRPVLPRNQTTLELCRNPRIQDQQKVLVTWDGQWLNPGQEYLDRHPSEVLLAYANLIPAPDGGTSSYQPLRTPRFIKFWRKPEVAVPLKSFRKI